MPRRRLPPQHNIPSQAPEKRTPYYPGQQQDIAQLRKFQPPHESSPGKGEPVYVVSTFDARPINSIDWSTYSGTHPDDTGFSPLDITNTIASIFYSVPSNYVAIVRDWHVLVVPRTGTIPGDETPTYPVFLEDGVSNFFVNLSFLINGVFQPEMSNRELWSLPFGDVMGNAYIIGQPGDTIEMRITGGTFVGGAGPNVQSVFSQAIMAMHGNLLVATGKQPQFEPGTDTIIPVQNVG